MNIKNIFLTNVKELLKDKKINFSTFSLELGINRRTMSRWFFDRSPSPQSVIKIADYFNCSVNFLLDRTDDPRITYSKSKTTFYERYCLLKERSDLNDSKIAKLCKIQPSAITNWKHGTIPTLTVVVCLCDIFYCSFDYLMARSDD